MDDLVLGMAPFGNASTHEFSAHDDTCLIGAGCQGLGLVSRQSHHDNGATFSAIPYPTFMDLASHDVASPSPQSPNAGDTFPEANTGKILSRIPSPGPSEQDPAAPEILSLMSCDDGPQNDGLFDEYAPSEPESNASCDSQCSGSKGPCSAGTCDFVTACRDENCTRPAVEPDVAHSAFILQTMTSAKETSANIASFQAQPNLCEHNMADQSYGFNFAQEAAPDCPDPGAHDVFAHMFQTQIQAPGSQEQFDQHGNLVQGDPFNIWALGPNPHCHAPALPGNPGHNGMMSFQGHATDSGNFPGECGVPFQDPLQASLHIQQHAQQGQNVPLMGQGLQYAQSMQLQHQQQPVLDFPGMGTAPAFHPSNNNFSQQPITPGQNGELFGFSNGHLTSPTNQDFPAQASPGIKKASLQPSVSSAGQELQGSPAQSSASANSPAQDTTDLTCQWHHGDSMCGMVFPDAHELEMHVQTEHVESMPKAEGGYICSWAGCARKHKPFVQKSKVKRHMLTHTQYKPFKCEYCSQTFSAKQALSQHVLIHKQIKPLECDICHKLFRQKSALTMHIRTHTGYKPLKCDICNTMFGESSNLSKHRRTHDIVGRHLCPEDFCEKRFHRLDQCRRHLETVHKRSSEEARSLVRSMPSRRGSSAPHSQSSARSDVGSNSASILPGQQVSPPVQAPQVGFMPQVATAEQYSSPANPGSMVGAMNSPSLLQFGQMPAQNSQLYGTQAGTAYGTPMGQNPFSAGGAIPNGAAYGFQPVPNFAAPAW